MIGNKWRHRSMGVDTSETEPLPDLLRAFLAWLDEARPRLAVATHIRRSTPEVIEGTTIR
jgi:hypothetical protein